MFILSGCALFLAGFFAFHSFKKILECFQWPAISKPLKTRPTKAASVLISPLVFVTLSQLSQLRYF